MNEPTPSTPTARPRVYRTSLPRLVADFYDEAPPATRLQLLSNLLKPVGPLALVAIGAGAFSRLLPSGRWQDATPSLDDVQRFTGDQVLELVLYVQQKSPEFLLQLPQLLGEPRLWLATLNGTLLWLALQALNRQRAGSAGSRPKPLSR
jgi:hypothetical protein